MNHPQCRHSFFQKVIVSFFCNALMVGNILPLYSSKAFAASHESEKFGWIQGNRAKATDKVSFRVWLRFKNEDVLTKFMDSVSDPRSPRYGQYKSLSEIRDMVQPSDESRVQVKTWLRSAGLDERSCKQDWDSYFCDRIPADLAERLLRVKLNSYQHTAIGNRTVLMTEDEVVVPASVHFVSGLGLYDPTIKARHSTPKMTRDITAFKEIFKSRVANAQSVSGSGSTIPPNDPDPLIMQFSNDNALAENFVILALNCADGSTTNINSYPVNWCSNVLDAPTSITVFLSQAGVQVNSQTFNTLPPPQGSGVCGAADSSLFWPNAYKNGGQANMVFCSLWVNFPLTLWERYEVTAQVTFGTGSTSNIVGYRNLGNEKEFGTIRLISSKPINPAKIESQYGLPTSVASETTPVTQGILELSNVDTAYGCCSNPSCSSGCGFLTSDVQAYMTNNNINVNIANLLTVIGSTSSMDQGETSLDVELIMGISPGTPTVLWNSEFDTSTSIRNNAEALLAWAKSISSPSNQLPSSQPAPSVWSISYGLPELQIGTTADLMNRINSHFMMLSASGVSIFASSGDSGAGSAYYSGAVPLFPATSPYVTAVGATALMAASTGGNPYEVVCSARDSNVITSGGGFSSNFAQPSYQQTAVSAYLANGNSLDPSIVTTNRAIPDVSALGAHIYTIQNGAEATMYGTSASSPLVAGIFSLINQNRVNGGMPTMGAVNPFLYQTAANTPSVFNDVTQGNNCVGEQPSSLPPVFFPSWINSQCYVAATGWDPVSGLGSINYQALEKAAMSWTPPIRTPAPTPIALGTSSSSSLPAIIAGSVSGGVVAIGLIAAGIYRWVKKGRAVLYDGSGISENMVNDAGEPSVS